MKSSNLERLSLHTLKGGAAIEQFDVELDRVMQNVADINTGLGAREITIKVKLKPDPDRSFLFVEVGVSSKLQPVESFVSQAYIGRENGRAIAFEHDPEQLRLNLTTNNNLMSFPGGISHAE